MFGRNLYVLLDADGCVYNHKYHEIILRIIHQFHLEIDLKATLPDMFDKFPLVEQINELLDGLDVAAMTTDSYKMWVMRCEPIAMAHSFDSDILAAPYSSTAIHYQLMSQFIRWLDHIDKKLLNRVLVLANHILFDSLVDYLEVNSDIVNVTFMVGSNRQAAKYDRYNAQIRATRPFYHDLPILADAFQRHLQASQVLSVVYLDKFILADIFSSRQQAAFDLASSLTINNDIQPDAIFDRDKVALIYAHMHHIAANDGEHDVLFYDDSSRILNVLNKVLSSHASEMVPESLKLTLKHTNGYKVSSVGIVRGESKRDKAYRRSVKIMAKMVGVDPYGRLGVASNYAQVIEFKEFFKKRDRLERRRARVKSVPKYGVNMPYNPLNSRNIGLFTSDNVPNSTSKKPFRVARRPHQGRKTTL